MTSTGAPTGRLRAATARPRGVIRPMWHRLGEHRILGLSAEAGFWQLVSFPSLMLAIFGALGNLGGAIGPAGIERLRTDVLQVAGELLDPATVRADVAPLVDELLKGGNAEVVSIGFFISLWSGSSATSSFLNTITVAYGMRGLRNAVHSRLIALGLYLLSVLAGITLLPALVLGPNLIAGLSPLAVRAGVSDVVHGVYWPAVVLLSILGVATLYRMCLPMRVPFREHLPGAVLAMLIWVGGSVVIRLYLTRKLRTGSFYGALAAPLAALLFFYVTALAVLVGAELNATLRVARGHAGPAPAPADPQPGGSP